MSTETSMRLIGYPQAEIDRILNQPQTDRQRIERVERVLADFDSLNNRRKKIVNVREFAEYVRQAVQDR